MQRFFRLTCAWALALTLAASNTYAGPFSKFLNRDGDGDPDTETQKPYFNVQEIPADSSAPPALNINVGDKAIKKAKSFGTLRYQVMFVTHSEAEMRVDSTMAAKRHDMVRKAAYRLGGISDAQFQQITNKAADYLNQKLKDTGVEHKEFEWFTQQKRYEKMIKDDDDAGGPLIDMTKALSFLQGGFNGASGARMVKKFSAHERPRYSKSTPFILYAAKLDAGIFTVEMTIDWLLMTSSITDEGWSYDQFGDKEQNYTFRSSAEPVLYPSYIGVNLTQKTNVSSFNLAGQDVWGVSLKDAIVKRGDDPEPETSRGNFFVAQLVEVDPAKYEAAALKVLNAYADNLVGTIMATRAD